MNVAIFSSSFYPHVGGVEEVVRQLAHEQQRNGDHPLVVTMRWPKTLDAAEEYETIPVRRHVFRTPEWSGRQLGGWLAFGMRTASRTAADVRDAGCDLVHVQCVSGNGLYALRVAERLDLPLVVTIQGEISCDADGVYQRSRFLPGLLKTLLQRADAVTACSAHALREAESFTGVPLGARGSVVNNGVRTQDFSGVRPFAHPRPYVLGIGRLVPTKGFDVLLRAFAMLQSEGACRYDLVLAGDGPARAGLERLGADLGIADRLVFPGAVDRTRTARLFAGCAVFALPSRHEGMGVVNLEAMAAGKPVVATAVGGVPEIIADEVNGLLVDPDDPTALAAALARLIDDVQLAGRLGREGQKRAADLDWAEIGRQYQTIYADAFVGHQSRA